MKAYSHFKEVEGMRWQDVLADSRCWPHNFFGAGEDFFWSPDSIVLPKFSHQEPPPCQGLPPPPAPPSPPQLPAFAMPAVPQLGLRAVAPPSSSVGGGKQMENLLQQYKGIMKTIGVEGTLIKEEVDYDVFDDDQDGFLLSLIEESEAAAANEQIANDVPESVQSGETANIVEPMDVDDSPVILSGSVKKELPEPVVRIFHCIWLINRLIC